MTCCLSFGAKPLALRAHGYTFGHEKGATSRRSRLSAYTFLSFLIKNEVNPC